MSYEKPRLRLHVRNVYVSGRYLAVWRVGDMGPWFSDCSEAIDYFDFPNRVFEIPYPEEAEEAEEVENSEIPEQVIYSWAGPGP
jgi:hypothetical protein